MGQTLLFFRRFFTCWFFLLSISLFIIYFFKQFDLAASFQYRVFFSSGLVALVSAVTASVLKKKKAAGIMVSPMEKTIRYFLAYILFFYAAAKIFGLQFMVSDEIKATRAGDLSGFDKAWLFFGHSYRYGLFIAGTQILTAAMLLFERTRTAGAFVYCMIMANIVVMDFAYGVESMQAVSLLLLGMSGFLLLLDARKLMFFLFSARPPARPLRLEAKPRFARNGLFICILAAGLVNEIIFFYHIKYGGR